MLRKTLSFTFSSKVGDFFIVMMSVLDKRQSKYNITSEGNQVVVDQRDPNEIITFTFNLEAMRRLVGSWLNQRNPGMTVSLNEEETELFKQCAHAAYYYITERPDNSPLTKSYIDTYKWFFAEP